mmetsp:Transcript_19400/g.73321  ORF Transcript_19400/g.73321 Transcript_19400/m.73321 type:complete len:320 (-) Transcript_19400:1042-2001(-)
MEQLPFSLEHVNSSTVAAVCDSRSAVGEGLVWDVAKQRLVWVDIEGKRLYQWAWGSDSATVETLPERIGCVALTETEAVVAAFEEGFAIYLPGEGIKKRLEGDYAQDEQKLLRLNDGKVDRQGRFVAGGFNGDGADGPDWPAAVGVFRIGPDGLVKRLIDEDVSCANSICFSPDGNTMYFTDSPKRKLLRFAYGDDTLCMSDGEVVADLDEIGIEEGVFDGACVDAEGCIWVCICFGEKVLRIDPARKEVVQMIDVPVRRPTCPVLAGPDLDILFITSIGPGIAEQPELTKCPLSGSLFAIRVGVPGVEDPLCALQADA